ncbi:S-layer homology domain-containing protein [Nitriliruptor alkaliphilus]|uniref:S-layer homology domain-containing protein n=1 Tax=Nitriliruptor alkaliphilus TaxID=427918 RepID=UPI000695B917|nr:S-layer homology domain-containing protein [Nitriliruptor alkaliphilus]
MRPTARLLSAVLLSAPLLVPLMGAGPTPSPVVGAADAAVAAVSGIADVSDVVVTAKRETLTTTGCRAPFRLDPVTGCVRDLVHGMIEYVGPDGARGTTVAPHTHPEPAEGHTGDLHDGHDHDGHDHDAVTVASTGSRALPSTRRPVSCAPDGSARTVVLYAHRPGADRRSDHLGTIRATLERSNQAVALSAQRSGGPLADLRVRCTSTGAVSVASVAVGADRFADLRAAVARAGYDRPHEKYLLFADFVSPDAHVAGRADMFLDDRRTVDNHNNGRAPMYAVVYGARHFGGSVALHELGHTMGAVQPGAPGSDGAGHCAEQIDVMCYPAAGSRCATMAFDCGNDTYFSTATRPGQWLHTHWNLGWEGNRFIRHSSSSASTSTRGPGGFTDTVGHAHGPAIATAVERRIASGYPDGTFRPGNAVTRGQMATFLTRALDLPAGDPSRFRDVGSHPHARGIGAVARAGITTGYPDGTFRPDEVVTRGQLASFLDRALRLPAAGRHRFTDVRGSTHEAAIARVAAAEITQGYRDGTFRPSQAVPRGQMATFLVRSLDRR